MPDYIPQSDPAFNAWQEIFINYAIANSMALGISISEKMELQSAGMGWTTHYLTHINAQNAAKGATENKEENKDTLESVIRQLTKKIQARAETTDAQREALGITVPDTTLTPLSENIVLTEPPPRVEAICTAPKQVRVDWYPSAVGTESKAKPQGIDGVAIWYAEGGIPADESGWRFLALDTNSPYVHNVGNDASITLAYKAQWFDRRKRMGPFCDPVTVAVTG